MKLPDTYSDLYPNRFLHADQLRGRKVTVTIKHMEIETLEGEKGREPKVIMHFKESPMQYVVPKTNMFCLKRMASSMGMGTNPNEWIGRMITIFPTTTKFGKATVDCIRVWGSPHLKTDMQITVPAGRKKPVEMTMHAVKEGECGYKGGADVIASAELPEEMQPQEQEPELPETFDHPEAAPDFDFVFKPDAEVQS